MDLNQLQAMIADVEKKEVSEAELNEAAAQIRELPVGNDNTKILILYKCYKQATIGDVNIAQPSFISVTDRAKWDAWNSMKGCSNNDAALMYCHIKNCLAAGEPFPTA